MKKAMGKVMVRKAVTFLLLVVFVFAFAAAAAAERQRFGNISADVPEGWVTQAAGNQVTFMAPDNVAALMIIVEQIPGTTTGDVAADLSQSHNGSTPADVGGGTYVFSFQDTPEIENHVVVVGIEGTDFYMMWVIGGEHPQLEALIESVEWVD